MTARDYHNEFDPFAAQWLRNLIAEGLLPPGDVDERSIEDVRPSDLAGYTRCHFFSGIGGWPLALRLAGWPDDRPVWTGSCPCQPFSAAGRGAGFADERHLWPSWFHLIRVWRPPVLFGEQVASGPAGAWCDLVQDDLEGVGYAFAAVPLPAASVGAPHIRDRLWWVADAVRGGAEHVAREGVGAQAAPDGEDGRLSGERLRLGIEGAPRKLADADGRDTGSKRQQPGGEHGQQQAHRISRELADAVPAGWSERRPSPGDGQAAGGGSAGLMGDTGRAGLALGSVAEDERGAVRLEGPTVGPAEPLRNPWSDAEWIWCRDGKHRPTQPGLFPLAHGVPGRVGKLRAYGNAIVPQVAAEFIRAYLDHRELMDVLS
ncbi:MAG: hypothetical protein RLZZ129_1481 [Verrucomicrobiota bacterium]